MKHIKHISIPTPCTQNWADMGVVDDGRFCSNCQKAVTDFTSLANSEIINILSSSSKVCGRFNEAQLFSLNNEIARYEIIPQRSSLFSWQKLSLAAAFIGFVPFIKAEAKVKPLVEHSPLLFKRPATQIDTVAQFKVITGIVTDSLKLPLAGARVAVKGTQFVTTTARDGRFSLTIPASPTLIGVVASIGFESKEFNIDHQINDYSFVLKQMHIMMGEVTITGYPKAVPAKPVKQKQ